MLWTLEKARANVVERAVVLTGPPADLGMKSSRKGAVKKWGMLPSNTIEPVIRSDMFRNDKRCRLKNTNNGFENGDWQNSYDVPIYKDLSNP